MQRLRRQLPFLRSMLQEANRSKRQELLQHAKADQIKADQTKADQINNSIYSVLYCK